MQDVTMADYHTYRMDSIALLKDNSAIPAIREFSLSSRFGVPSQFAFLACSPLSAQAGKGLPLVSTPNGNSASAMTKKTAVNATGIPMVP